MKNIMFRRMKHRRSVLITDLDDTIWDWLSVWHASFRNLYTALQIGSGLSDKELISEIRSIHQEVGTSEYYFLPHHLEVRLGRSSDPEEVKARYGNIESIFINGQRDGTKLGNGVLETLKSIKKSGAEIIAYTESMSFGSVERIKATFLDGIIDTLYSREDHAIPDGVNLSEVRSKPDATYQLNITRHVRIDRKEMKPNPEVLASIVSDSSGGFDDCVYVGDKLLKDVKMAQDSGVLDVYANYGDQTDSKMYDLLKQVTHWSESDVSREHDTKGTVVSPTITLNDNFSEILNYIDFYGGK